MIVKSQEKQFIELKLMRILLQQLVRCIDELGKNRRQLFAVAANVTTTVAEFMPER